MNTTISLLISLAIFVLIIRGQFRGMQKPMGKSGISLLIPILYISTSLFQLMDPTLHLSQGEVLTALLIGLCVSIPLIAMTNFEVRPNGDTFIKRGRGVLIFLIAVFALRFILVFSIQSIDSGALGFIANLVTLSYIAVWRSASFLKFRKALQQRPAHS
ncbi:CcdC protein domain-containing protein [Paenibacillus filicis]|uniref:CcdC protein domain-containing protein n=1 Tax=Paenibacillus filicis TaxID=669464 RepID=A0ABU9DWD8_9BACL